MPKYKIQKTDILHNKKLYPQGSEIELDDKDAEKLRNYLVPVREKEPKTTKTTTNTTKTTSKPAQNNEVKENEVTE